MAVKEYVRQQLYGEMEPLKVQVALLQKQLHVLEETCKAVVPARSMSRDSNHSGRGSPSEKKLDEMGPSIENWMHDHESKLSDQTARLTKAEGVLRELGALHDKFAQRHDSLVECVQDLDTRIDHVDKAHSTLRKNMELVPSTAPQGPLSSVPEHRAAAHHEKSAMPPGWVPPPGAGGFAGAAPSAGPPNVPPAAPGTGAAAHVWTASEHQASLEVEEFSFDVDRRPGMSLGMILRNDGSKLVVDQMSEGSAVPVSVGDRIVAIAGIRGDSKVLLELIRRTGKFQITCQRLLSTTL